MSKEYQKERIQELKRFLENIRNNQGRNLISVNLKYEHKRFKDNTGFAHFKTESRSVCDDLNSKFVKAIEEQIEEEESKLKYYGEDKEERSGD